LPCISDTITTRWPLFTFLRPTARLRACPAYPSAVRVR
jgi:hypothetical protein